MDEQSKSWLLKSSATQLTSESKDYKSANDLMYPCAHATLDDETIKLTGFSSVDKLFRFIRGFFCPEGLPIFFTQ